MTPLPSPSETRDSIERRIAKIEKLLDAANSGWLQVTPVDEDESNVCIKHAHFDLWRYETMVDELTTKPGYTLAKLSQTEANVGCYLGEEADARLFANAARHMRWLIAELRKSIAANDLSGPSETRGQGAAT